MEALPVSDETQPTISDHFSSSLTVEQVAQLVRIAILVT